MKHFWYTQNEDYPQLNDRSEVRYENGVLTVSCNDHSAQHKVTGPPPTQEQLQEVENLCGDQPVCPDDVLDVVNKLGLQLAN